MLVEVRAAKELSVEVFGGATDIEDGLVVIVLRPTKAEDLSFERMRADNRPAVGLFDFLLGQGSSSSSLRSERGSGPLWWVNSGIPVWLGRSRGLFVLPCEDNYLGLTSMTFASAFRVHVRQRLANIEGCPSAKIGQSLLQPQQDIHPPPQSDLPLQDRRILT